MKFIVAPDSYKDCMRSPKICEIVRESIHAVLPDAKVVSLPLADGGEGTVEAAVLATKGRLETVIVQDPLGRPVEAQYGILGTSKTAILEMAAASGLELLGHEERNPLLTSTVGTGELVRHILDEGIRDIIIGIGGSATVDGGTGLAQELGVVFRNGAGEQLTVSGGGMLTQIRQVDVSGLDSRLAETRIRVACDVTNPLLGESGAPEIFGPQKGATPDMVVELERGMASYAASVSAAGIASDWDSPGDGAAGGLGYALRVFCGAEMVSGAGLMIEIVGLRDHLQDADVVITGEGCTDGQTCHGKLCAVVGETAKAAGVPCILLSGVLMGDVHPLEELFAGCYGIVNKCCSVDDAVAAAQENLGFTCRNVVRTFAASAQR